MHSPYDVKGISLGALFFVPEAQPFAVAFGSVRRQNGSKTPDIRTLSRPEIGFLAISDVCEIVKEF
jgi:hypothetical protein